MKTVEKQHYPKNRIKKSATAGTVTLLKENVKADKFPKM